MISKKALNRKEQFENYKRRRKLSDFRFFVHSFNSRSGMNYNLYVVHNKMDLINVRFSSYSSMILSIKKSLGEQIFEILSLSSLLKRVNCSKTKMFLCDEKQGYEVESFNELRLMILIKQLAGI